MRKNMKIIIIVIIILLAIITAAAYLLLTPQYKTIDINGYTLEVPDTNNSINTINDNYKTYTDQENNITIKTYAINNITETNYTGAADIGEQIGSNIGTNTTLADKTVMNKSGTYTYYNLEAGQMIVITTKDKDTMEHILKSMNKTQIETDELNLTTLISTDNTTDNNTTTATTNTQSKTSTSKSTTKSQKSSSDDRGGDYEDDEWVYGHGAGSSPDPDITWKHNKKTGYSEYYNSKTGQSWSGYNIA